MVFMLSVLLLALIAWSFLTADLLVSYRSIVSDAKEITEKIEQKCNKNNKQ